MCSIDGREQEWKLGVQLRSYYTSQMRDDDGLHPHGGCEGVKN